MNVRGKEHTHTYCHTTHTQTDTRSNATTHSDTCIRYYSASLLNQFPQFPTHQCRKHGIRHEKRSKRERGREGARAEANKRERERERENKTERERERERDAPAAISGVRFSWAAFAQFGSAPWHSRARI